MAHNAAEEVGFRNPRAPWPVTPSMTIVAHSSGLCLNDDILLASIQASGEVWSCDADNDAAMPVCAVYGATCSLSVNENWYAVGGNSPFPHGRL